MSEKAIIRLFLADGGGLAVAGIDGVHLVGKDQLPAPFRGMLRIAKDARRWQVAGKGRGPRGRADDCPLRARKEDPGRGLQQRLS